MFLLIRSAYYRKSGDSCTLHSNMFLLILKCGMKIERDRYYFTFQYVSINTIYAFLVIVGQYSFTFQYVSINTKAKKDINTAVITLHSNMFLLILGCPFMGTTSLWYFTFQYVSINTSCGFHPFNSINVLYIPICFY